MSTGNTIKEWLEAKDFDVVRVGDNWNVDCPFCDDTKHRLGFAIETGQWNCLNGGCDARGKTFRSFQRRLGDTKTEVQLPKAKAERKLVTIDQGLCAKYHGKLPLPGRDALDYLKSGRGFSQEAIDHFQLGSWKTNGHEYISIPYWKRGRLVNIKFRAVGKQVDRKWKWRRIKGGESSLFHDDACDWSEFKDIFICEAECDAVSLFSNGIKNVVSVTVGAKGFKQEWFDRLEKFQRVFLVYDSDVDGQAGAEKMAKRLGLDRCLNVRLPKEIKDVNQFFWDDEAEKQRNTKTEFMALVKDARKFEVEDVTSLKYALKDLHKDLFLEERDEIFGFQTPWKRVNKLIRGAKPGHLVVVSANPKVGKTSIVLQWMVDLAKRNEVNGLFYCCEMREKRLAEKVVAMSCNDFTASEEITPIQLAETSYIAPSERVFFGYPRKGALELEAVCEKIKETVQRYGIQFVVFDNLHFLVRGENVRDKVGEVTRRFKVLAETLNIVFVLIVHPRKTGGRLVTAEDLKDSSSIYQDLDLLIILHREEEAKSRGDKDIDDEGGASGHLSPLCEVHVCGRWIEGGRALLYFNGQRSLFFDNGQQFERALKAWKLKRKSEASQKRKTLGHR